MDKKKLLNSLNWFYNLELNQVDLYFSQSKTFNDAYIKLAFERIAYIEQQHVDNIAAKIKDLGGKPSSLGDIISPIMGSFAGKIISFSGFENTLKINIALEQKAMEDYRKLINNVKKDNSFDQELLKTLEHNLIDEDLHTAWFTNKLISSK